MRRVILWKEVGETPLQAIEKWKTEHPAYKDVPAAYAGRLDPMAEGKLLVLLGDECKKQKKYHELDKEYEIEVLLDVGSDTGDALGLVEYSGKETRVDPRILQPALTREVGKHVRPYPVYSSKTVKGKQLFLYALEGTLDTIEIPQHEELIRRITYIGADTISAEALVTRLEAFFAKVPRTTEPSKALGADFRIDAVRERWERVFERTRERDFIVLRLRIACASGTYMRSLAPRIGESLGTKGLALSIRRTRIGRYIAGFWLETDRA